MSQRQPQATPEAAGKEVVTALTSNQKELDATQASQEVFNQMQAVHGQPLAAQEKHLSTMLANETLQAKGVLPALEIAHITSEQNFDRLSLADGKKGFTEADLLAMQKGDNAWERKIATDLLDEDNKALLERITRPEFNREDGQTLIRDLKRDQNKEVAGQTLENVSSRFVDEEGKPTKLMSMLDGNNDGKIGRSDMERYLQATQSQDPRRQLKNQNPEDIKAVRELLANWDSVGSEQHQELNGFTGDTLTAKALTEARQRASSRHTRV